VDTAARRPGVTSSRRVWLGGCCVALLAACGARTQPEETGGGRPLSVRQEAERQAAGERTPNGIEALVSAPRPTADPDFDPTALDCRPGQIACPGGCVDPTKDPCGVFPECLPESGSDVAAGAGPHFHPVARLATGHGNARMSMDSSGGTHLVWIGPNWKTLCATHYSVATAQWEAAQLIETVTGYHDAIGGLTASGDGNLSLLWTTDRGIFSRPYDAAERRWGSAVTVDTIGSGVRALAARSLVRTADGGSLLLWERTELDASGASMGTLMAARSTPSGDFLAPPIALHVTSSGSWMFPDAQCGEAACWATWVSGDADERTVYTARHELQSNVWSTPEALGAAPNANIPRIALAADGDVFVTWPSRSEALEARWWTPSSARWSEPWRLDGDEAPDGPAAATFAGPVAVVAWRDVTPGMARAGRLFATTRSGGDQGWSAAENLMQSNRGSNPPDLVNDGRGRALLAWLEHDRAGGAAFARLFSSDSTSWQPVVRLDDAVNGTWSDLRAQVATDGAGRWSVFWSDPLVAPREERDYPLRMNIVRFE